MDAKTLTALQGSIAKWEAIVAGTGADEAAGNCPLCELFYVGADRDCEGCPVAERTGVPYCRGTPYGAFAAASERARSLSRASTPELIRLAQDELDFLREVLAAP